MDHKHILMGLFLALSFFISKSYGSHTAGGSITWEQIGKDTLKVTATVYRDCNSRTMGNTPINAYSNCGTMKVTSTLSSGEDITPVCDEQCTGCDSKGCTFKYGLQKWEFSGIVVVTSWRRNSCCDITIAWSQCCRAGGITTGAANNNLYLESKINICDTTHLWKVDWHDDPINIACLGRDFISVHSGLESNHPSDSFAHRFTEPLQTATSRTSWSSPYSYDKPVYHLGFPKPSLAFPRGLHLESSTGLLKFRPMKGEYTIMAIGVDIYRNGSRIGTITRDIVFIVIKCPDNNPPVLSAMKCKSPLNGPFFKNVCAGEQVKFEVCVSDKDKDDTVRLSYHTSAPGAKITMIDSSGKRPGLRFNWQTDSSHIQKKPFYLYIEAYDNSCPVKGITSRLYEIKVDGGKPATITASNIGCGEYRLEAKTDSADHFKWIIDGLTTVQTDTVPKTVDTLIHRFNKTGTADIKVISSKNGQCMNYGIASLKLSSDYLWFKKPNDTLTDCLNDTLNLNIEAFNARGTPTIVWENKDSLKSTKHSFKHHIQKKDWVSYRVYDTVCFWSDSLLVRPWKSGHISLSKRMVTCHNNPGSFILNPFSDTLTRYDSIQSMVWQYPIGTTVSTDSQFVAKNAGKYLFKAQSSNGCYHVDTLELIQKQLVFTNFNDTSICTGTSIALTAQAKKAGYFNWYFGGNDINNSQGQYYKKDSISLVINQSTNIWLKYFDTTLNVVCTDVSAFRAKVFAKRRLALQAPTKACLDDTLKLGSGLNAATWIFGNDTLKGQSVGFYLAPSLPGSRPHYISHSGFDVNGCFRDTSVSFYAYNKPRVDFSLSKDSVKRNKTFSPTNRSLNNVAMSYLWTIGDPQFEKSKRFSPTFQIDSVGVFPIKLIGHNQTTTCTDSVIRNIKIFEVVSITEKQSEIAVYPNPATEQLFVHWKNQTDYHINLLNGKGQSVYTQSAVSGTTALDLSSLPNGIYLLKLENADIVKTTLIEVIH